MRRGPGKEKEKGHVPRAREPDEGGEGDAGVAAFHVIDFPRVVDARRVKGNEPRHADHAEHVDEDRASGPGRGVHGMMVIQVFGAGCIHMLTVHYPFFTVRMVMRYGDKVF